MKIYDNFNFWLKNIYISSKKMFIILNYHFDIEINLIKF